MPALGKAWYYGANATVKSGRLAYVADKTGRREVGQRNGEANGDREPIAPTESALLALKNVWHRPPPRGNPTSLREVAPQSLAA